MLLALGRILLLAVGLLLPVLLLVSIVGRGRTWVAAMLWLLAWRGVFLLVAALVVLILGWVPATVLAVAA